MTPGEHKDLHVKRKAGCPAFRIEEAGNVAAVYLEPALGVCKCGRKVHEVYDDGMKEAGEESSIPVRLCMDDAVFQAS
jgi:hypothetical protein